MKEWLFRTNQVSEKKYSYLIWVFKNMKANFNYECFLRVSQYIKCKKIKYKKPIASFLFTVINKVIIIANIITCKDREL